MHLSLPEKLEAFAQEQVGEGFYSSASEYVRELIRKDMQQKDRQHQQAFYAAVQVGDNQIAQGHGIPFDDQTMQQLGQQARENPNG